MKNSITAFLETTTEKFNETYKKKISYIKQSSSFFTRYKGTPIGKYRPPAEFVGKNQSLNYLWNQLAKQSLFNFEVCESSNISANPAMMLKNRLVVIKKYGKIQVLTKAKLKNKKIWIINNKVLFSNRESY